MIYIFLQHHLFVRTCHAHLFSKYIFIYIYNYIILKYIQTYATLQAIAMTFESCWQKSLPRKICFCCHWRSGVLSQWCFSSFFMLYLQASMAMVWQCLLSRAFGEVELQLSPSAVRRKMEKSHWNRSVSVQPRRFASRKANFSRKWWLLSVWLHLNTSFASTRKLMQRNSKWTLWLFADVPQMCSLVPLDKELKNTDLGSVLGSGKTAVSLVRLAPNMLVRLELDVCAHKDLCFPIFCVGLCLIYPLVI